MLDWVVGGVGDDCVRECGFSMYGGYPVCGVSLDCDVQVVYFIVGFCFGCEFGVWVDLVEVGLCVIDVCVVGVVN